LYVVDLDLKPLVKIPLHAALDARILAVAAEHKELLQRSLDAQRSWVKAWRSGRV
jgi:hypothetical protein